ncbi:co-chaperone GroES [Marinobacterium sediminicola]|uniref:Co-chaperonin GroES n=1 Tax=Marinobacterium sediminicola TaxID=518898 RepID=A0ABY1RXE6_9GAMM|nr:co-chaperone GroES [Marinobacterium sediminicola]ULG67810.1 co-chaperone GroES [Marinobacterium sediminicola]SMR71513.1 chaperonin GroES [Marinobacterium sediminicola]
MSIRPLDDRLVVRRVEAETTTKGGIVIPDKSAEKPSQGEVVAVGEGAVLENGERRKLEVKVGDRVLFAKYAGNEVKLDGESLLIMRESDVLAIIEDTPAEEEAA